MDASWGTASVWVEEQVRSDLDSHESTRSHKMTLVASWIVSFSKRFL